MTTLQFWYGFIVGGVAGAALTTLFTWLEDRKRLRCCVLFTISPMTEKESQTLIHMHHDTHRST